MKVKLMEWLKKGGGFHSSLSATYSCDLPWYERILQERFRLSGCHNNLLMVDAGTYAQTLPSLRLLAPGAGRRYTVLPIYRGAGAFHPKIILQLGERKARALVASANLSMSGFGVNHELATELSCTEAPDEAQALIASLYDYLCQLCHPRTPAVSHHLEMLERDAPWLARALRWHEPPQGSLAETALLLSPGEGSLVRQLKRRVAGDRIRRLVVLAPFWDAGLDALAELDAHLAPTALVLIVQPDTVQLQRHALKRFGERIRISAWEGADGSSASKRYLHAKLYLAEGDRADHLVTGSANCSVAALGLEGVPPINAEACVYRALAPGTGAEALGITSMLADDRRLSPDSIREPDELKKDTAPVGWSPGVVEISGARVVWWPKPGASPGEVRLELLDERLEILAEIPGAEAGSGPVVFELPAVERGRLRYARIRTPVAGSSSLVLIHFQDELRAAAPGVAAGRFQTTLERIRLGGASLTDLLEPFESLFFEKGRHEDQVSSRRSAGGGGARDEEGEPPGQLLSYEEFLSGRTAGKPTSAPQEGRTISRIGVLVEILMESLTLESTPAAVIESEEAREQEPDEPDPDDDRPPRTRTVDEVRQSRGKLVRLTGRFVEWADQQRRGTPEITPQEISRVWAAISLMAFLMGERGVGANESTERVLPLVMPGGEPQFLTLSRDILGAFFSVPMPLGSPTPLAGQLQLPAGIEFLPADVEGALVAARWAACLGRELAERSGISEHVEDFEVVGRAVFRIPVKGGDGSLGSRRGARLSIRSRVEEEVPAARLEHWYAWFEERVRVEHEPDGWKPQLVRRVEKQDLLIGQCVWTKGWGLRYVREFREKKVYVNNPGAGQGGLLSVNRGFVTPILRQTPTQG